MKGLATGIIVALIAAGLLAAALLTGVFPGREVAEDEDQTEEAPESSEEDASGVPAPGNEDGEEMIVGDGVVEVAVEGDEYEFEPEDLIFEQGASVRLTFKNTGDTPHTWTIDALNIDTGSIGPGQSRTVEFDVPGTGTYEIYCAVPGHVELGMVGKLVVE